VLSQLLESWVSLYANHAALRTGIEFLHIVGLLPLHLLKKTHRLVVLGLVALALSGLLLFGADIETFVYSRIFWLKMGLMALLLVNGALLLRGERQAARGEADAWPRLHHTAIASLVLWFLTTLAGAALPNIG
jgi:hypothetical protein